MNDAPLTAASLLAMARAMDQHAAERYRELASAFEMSCNTDTADAFRRLAEISTIRAEEFGPSTTKAASLAWFEDCPEISDPDAVHYLMLPWHAFDLARRLDERCREHFQSLSEAATLPDIRDTASHLAERQTRHVEKMTTLREDCPAPHPGWWEDQDGPNWDGD